MKDYYYIKCTKLGCDTYYLCLGNNLRKQPVPLKIFDSIEDAVNFKHNEFDEDAFRSIFEDYEMTIERL